MEQKKSLKVIVTGGAGFIGSNFLRYMIKKYPNYHFVNIDKLTYAGNKSNLSDIELESNYSFVREDICNFDVMNEIIEPDSIIINFAAESHVDNSLIGPFKFTHTNAFGTHVLLEVAKKKKARLFMQISTDEVYGSLNFNDTSSKENDILKPSSPYSASKASAEMLCFSYMKTYNMPIIITRSSNNFGPYQYPEKVIPLFVTNLIEGKKVPLYGSGNNIRDWVYVQDNCEALDFIIHNGKTGEIYNIGGGNEIPNIELTKRILKLMNFNEDKIQYVEDRLGHDLRYSLDSSKIIALGWRPRFSFDEALKKTIEWYKKNDEYWMPLKFKGKYLIIGNGFLGNRLKNYFGDKAFIYPKKINSVEDALKAIEMYKPEYLINCAGKTGRPNVDGCENEPEDTFYLNVTLPWFIAEACQKTGKKMIHLSTGCIYSGDNNGRGFSEEDEPNFFGSVYSRTKMMAERILKNYDILQIRLRIPVDEVSNERNLIDKLLKYTKTTGKILIASNSMTPVPFLVKAIEGLIEKKQTGVFNVVAKGAITHDFILDTYEKLSGQKLNYEKINAMQLDKMTQAGRSNCLLSTQKLESTGIEVPKIENVVEDCVRKYIANMSIIKEVVK